MAPLATVFASGLSERDHLMNSFEILDMTINNSRAAVRLIDEVLANLTEDDAEFDVAIQIKKDNENFIGECIHLKSLVSDGLV